MNLHRFRHEFPFKMVTLGCNLFFFPGFSHFSRKWNLIIFVLFTLVFKCPNIIPSTSFSYFVCCLFVISVTSVGPINSSIIVTILRQYN